MPFDLIDVLTASPLSGYSNCDRVLSPAEVWVALTAHAWAGVSLLASC